jgi:hypothetical protein
MGDVTMRMFLALAMLAAVCAATPASSGDRPTGGFDRADCLRAGKVVGPQTGAPLTCCYDDGCWICGQGWQGCKWKAGSASLDPRGGMGSPATGSAAPGAHGRGIPGAMQSPATPVVPPSPR